METSSRSKRGPKTLLNHSFRGHLEFFQVHLRTSCILLEIDLITLSCIWKEFQRCSQLNEGMLQQKVILS
ncbi:hypothetical protein FGO68_gene6694 [Halteria grandinella]|uniref:Uncharacterized protein n=1 Tax=Halteria grandinella TaxID=5974 RepID=A0A8J8P2N8_HALGN|nr:hypothetical protein FGO68_gene6694 [Halteria grandinella]